MKSRSQISEYCFLAGTGRSGTTVLRNSFGLHQEIYYNGKENNVVQDVIDVARHNFVSPSRQFALVVDKDTYCTAFRDLLIRILWPNPEFGSRPVRMAAINPSGETMEFLLEIFPNAKVIGLVRDGIDVVLSRQRHRSFKRFTFESHCQTWVRTQGVVEWGELNPNNFRLFRYDSLSDRKTLSTTFAELFGWGWGFRRTMQRSNMCSKSGITPLSWKNLKLILTTHQQLNPNALYGNFGAKRKESFSVRSADRS